MPLLERVEDCFDDSISSIAFKPRAKRLTDTYIGASNCGLKIHLRGTTFDMKGGFAIVPRAAISKGKNFKMVGVGIHFKLRPYFESELPFSF